MGDDWPGLASLCDVRLLIHLQPGSNYLKGDFKITLFITLLCNQSTFSYSLFCHTIIQLSKLSKLMSQLLN